jgi:hypothetical protein
VKEADIFQVPRPGFSYFLSSSLNLVHPHTSFNHGLRASLILMLSAPVSG